jgi:ribosomal protein S27AE
VEPFLIIALFFGLAGGVVGRIKGSSFVLWFLISAIPPFIGLLAAVFYRVERDEPRRACPTCGKVVMLYDALCTRCGSELDYTDEVIAPESAVARR